MLIETSIHKLRNQVLGISLMVRELARDSRRLGFLILLQPSPPGKFPKQVVHLPIEYSVLKWGLLTQFLFSVNNLMFIPLPWPTLTRVCCLLGFQHS